MRKTVTALTDRYDPAVRSHFFHLHAHPELSCREEQTAGYIAGVLGQLGLEPREGVGGYGVTAVIRGAAPGPCVALRADMDALPLTEDTGLAYASQNPGVMHACGHDAHMAMLLGAAMVLRDLRHSFRGCVKLIFQPSEETPAHSGARKMIEEGVLENPKVDAVIGQHINTLDDTGVVSTRPGVASAASDRFRITVEGVASHGARPHLGVDAIAVAAQLITAAQTVVSRNVDPRKSAVISIGRIRGGDRYNVVAAHAEMEGTCRTLDPEVRDLVQRRLEETVRGVGQAMGARCALEYDRGYGSIVNSPRLTALFREAAESLQGAHRVIIPREVGMGAEDFSYYTRQVPGLYFKTGCHQPGTPVRSSHNAQMVVDPDCLKVGVGLMALCALKILEEDGI